MKNDRRESPFQKQSRLQGNVRPNPDTMGGKGMINTPGSGISMRDSITLSVDKDGYCVLTFTATICGDDDFVGVYVNASQPEDKQLDWEWCTHTSSFPYVTDVAAVAGYVGIYWSKDYRSGQYVAVAITPALPANPVAGTKVTQSSS